VRREARIDADLTVGDRRTKAPSDAAKSHGTPQVNNRVVKAILKVVQMVSVNPESVDELDMSIFSHF
jgi:hypothetical protein